jgi:hypothetical protein
MYCRILKWWRLMFQQSLFAKIEQQLDRELVASCRRSLLRVVVP